MSALRQRSHERHLAILFSIFLLKDQLYDTVINKFVLKNSARRFTESTYRDTSHPCREIEWHVFGLCTINCIRINRKNIIPWLV